VFLLWFPRISSHYQTARQTQSGRELLTHFAAGLHLSSHFQILSYSTVLPYCSLNLTNMVSPPKWWLPGVPLGGDQAPLLPPEAVLNLNQYSYQSDEQCSPPLAGSCASLGSVVHPRPSPWLTERMNPPVVQSVHWHLVGSPPGGPGGCISVTMEVITHHLHNPGNEPPGNVAGVC
jgi:hypothetical protein